MTLTRRQVRDLLERHHLAAAKARGQHFVVDPNTARKTVRDARVANGDHVVEIGPGLGSLTLALLETGARVTAVEIDRGLAAALAEVLGDAPVEIVVADAVGIDHAALTRGRRSLLVANLPYNVATALVIESLTAGAYDRLHVMVQREVGQRWVAARTDPPFGAVSVKIAAHAGARIVASVPRRAFYPVPNVDSVTVALTPRPWSHRVRRDAVLALVDEGFAQRRKRLRNALARPGRPPQAIEAALLGAGLDSGARAEELELGDWVRLAELVVA